MMDQVPDQVVDILKKLKDGGHESYIVGGAVRDLIMKRPTTDWDLTTNATPEQIQNIFPDSFYTNTFGTVGVSIDEIERPIEITTFRSEHGYGDNRRPDKVEWGDSIEEDLKRRDFTINAIALAIANGKEKFIDPFGGKKDIDNRLVKAVGDPNERFSEDALRLMRALRIASELNFKIDKETKEAIKTNKERIHKISRERIRDEFLKLISSPHAYNALEQMRETGLLEELFPEIEKAFGVEQKSPGRHHIYDVGTHLFMSLKFCKSQDPIVRLATLLHDIGKPQTYKLQPNGVITFYNHEVVGARMTKDIADRLRLSKKQKDKLWLLVRYHQFTVDENQTDSAVKRFIRKVGVENIEDMLDLRTADRLGGGASETSWRTEDFKKRIVEVQKQPFSVNDLKIDGTDVMKILDLKPGPEVGKILKSVFGKVDNNELENTKEALVEFVRENYK